MIPPWQVLEKGVPWKALFWATVALAVASAVFLVYQAGASAEARERDLEVAQENVGLLKRQLVDQQARIKAATELGQARMQAAKVISDNTKEQLRVLSTRVPADACPLPGGFRVQHDEAALGMPPTASAPGGPDAAPVAPQDAARIVTENYGQYHDLADRQRRLQQYVNEQCNPTSTSK